MDRQAKREEGTDKGGLGEGDRGRDQGGREDGAGKGREKREGRDQDQSC